MKMSIETDNNKKRKNVATDEKYILWKMELKFGNPKFNLLYK